MPALATPSPAAISWKMDSYLNYTTKLGNASVKGTFDEADDVPSREELLARDGDMKLFVGGASPKYLFILNEEWTKERTKPPCKYLGVRRSLPK